MQKKSRLKTILAEKIVDGKLEIQQYTFSNIIPKEDIQRTMQLDNQTSNWVYVCNTYNSGIVLFDGKASKLGDNLWGNSSKFMNYELPEWKEQNYTSFDSQKQNSHEYSYQIIFSVNTEEIQENELFMTLSLELGPEFQNNDNYVLIAGFELETAPINHKNLLQKSTLQTIDI